MATAVLRALSKSRAQVALEEKKAPTKPYTVRVGDTYREDLEAVARSRGFPSGCAFLFHLGWREMYGALAMLPGHQDDFLPRNAADRGGFSASQTRQVA